jgi:hypothetical protein
MGARSSEDHAARYFSLCDEIHILQIREERLFLSY